MVATDLVATYLDAPERADLPGVLRLFAPNAMVYSPLYGPTPATSLYPRLFRDTAKSRPTLRGVLEGRTSDGKRPLVAFWFHFVWRFNSGEDAPFDCIDLAELDEDGRIVTLRVVYDTANVRPAFERQIGATWKRVE
jgi:ketosteroid isomerase-like protein